MPVCRGLAISLFYASLCVHVVWPGCMKRIVILPLFSGATNCGQTKYYEASGCGQFVRFFVGLCSSHVTDKL